MSGSSDGQNFTKSGPAARGHTSRPTAYGPSAPDVPTVPRVPSVQSVPRVPSVSDVPRVPSVPRVPGVPGIPTVPSVPLGTLSTLGAPVVVFNIIFYCSSEIASHRAALDR